MKSATFVVPMLAGVIAVAAVSCSKKEPTLEDIVKKADAEIKPGDKLAFVRLSNNGLVENATVQKVEDSFVLITTDEKDGSPYWINLASAVSYQQDSLVRRPRGKDVVDGQSEPSIKLEEVSSIEEVIKSLSELSVKPPKPWEELGILERDDWMAQFTREAPDYVMSGSVVVDKVYESWALSIYGTYKLPKTVSQQIALKHLPMKAAFDFKSSDSDSQSFPQGTRDRIKTLQKGDTYAFAIVLRPGFAYSQSDGKVTVSLGIESFN